MTKITVNKNSISEMAEIIAGLNPAEPVEIISNKSLADTANLLGNILKGMGFSITVSVQTVARASSFYEAEVLLAKQPDRSLLTEEKALEIEAKYDAWLQGKLYEGKPVNGLELMADVRKTMKCAAGAYIGSSQEK